MSTLAERLGREVKALREKRGMTQTELAWVLGVTPAAVCVVERRRAGAGNMNLSTLEQLAWALEADLVVELRPR